MVDLNSVFTYAALAQASYADFSGLSYNPSILGGGNWNEQVFIADLQTESGGFTLDQAQNLSAQGWVVAYQSETALYGEDYSGALFYNTNSKEYVLANRGTQEAVPDIAVADGIGIVISGAAKLQIAQMIDFYERLSTPLGQPINFTPEQIAAITDLAGDNATQFIVSEQAKKGLGIIPSGTVINLAGHSLGGHLSDWLAAFFPASVGTVTNFNGAGNGGLVQSAISAVFGGLSGQPVQTTLNSKVTGYYASGGSTLIAGVGGAVGQQLPVFIEAKDNLDSLVTGLYNHKISNLTDSLALASLVSTLDPSTTVSSFNALAEGANSVNAGSLDSVLDRLRALILGQSVVTGSPTVVGDRNSYYTNLVGLKNALASNDAASSIKNIQGAVSIKSVSQIKPHDVRSNFEEFMALVLGSTFYLQANTTAADQQLKSANPQLYSKWLADSAAMSAGQSPDSLNFTDQWIANRIQYLSMLNVADTSKTTSIQKMIPDTWIYSDSSTGKTLTVSPTQTYNVSGMTHDVIFGGTDATPMNGGSDDDSLFGGAGNRTINGEDGNDYIEGGSGNDLIYGGDGKDKILAGSGNTSVDGGAGDDTLIGGSGNDTLKGGDGNDSIVAGNNSATLIGGNGNDTLVAGSGSDILEGDAGNNVLIGGAGFDLFSFFSGDQGNNIITDPSGNGELLLDGAVLTGGTEIGPNEWQSGNVTYQLQPGQNGKSDLLITLSNQQTVLIQGYTPGALGITLEGQYAPSVVTSSGSLNVDTQVIGTVTYYSSTDNSAPSVMNVASALDGSINKIVATGNSSIFGSASEDLITVANGANYIVGGGGPDGIMSGNGNSTIYAGSVLSVAQLVTGSGTGAQGAFVATGDGNNTIYGSQGNDAIYTGSGNNLIYTGAGDDIINLSYADVVYSISKDWESYGYADGEFGDIVDVEGIVNVSSGPKSGSGLVPAGYEGAIDFATPNHPNGTGNNTVIGGTGNNLIMLSNGNNLVQLNSGNSTVFGGMGSDTIFSGSGSDIVFGGGGDSYIVAGSGNQHIYGEGGNNVIYGGSGSDTIYAGDNPTFRTGTAGYNHVEAGSGNTLIFGSSLSDSLYGGDGNDTINAGDGTEYIDGGEGNNQLFAGAGADTLVSSGSGNDSLVGNSGFVTMIGGSGTDYFYLNGPTATGDAVVYAGDGSAGTGPSMVYGGTGNTTVIGGAGALQVQGGSGDLLVDLTLSDGENPVSVFAGSGDTTVYGGDAPVYIVGGSGNDELYAGDGGTDDNASYVRAGSGDSSLYGGAGSATLDASQTSANDLLVGGDGHTVMLGGSGSDTFVAGAGETDITLGSGANLIQTTAGDGNIFISGEQAATNVQFDAATSVSNISLVQGTNANGILEWGIDTPDGSLYLPTGLTASTRFQFADGTTLSFAQLLAKGAYVNDGVGNTTTRTYASDGTLTGDAWTKADGSSGSDAFNTDGSVQSVASYANGNTRNTATDPQGNATFTLFNATGTEIGSGTQSANGAGTWRVDNTDGSYSVVVTDGLGDITTTNFNAAGIGTSDGWSRSDGSSGSDLFNADGSSSGNSTNADGSSTTYTNDGLGDIVTTSYSANGTETGSVSQTAAGGTTTLTINPDGSSTSVTNDGQGDFVTTYTGTNGSVTGDTWSKADGSHGADTISGSSSSGFTDNVDGTSTHYIDYDPRDGVVTTYNVQGIATGDTWFESSGSTGADTFNADGSSSGTQSNPDGSTDSYTNDGKGDVTTVNFGSTGAKISDSWQTANGSSGTDTFYSDGSSSGTTVNTDGSSSISLNDGRGDTFTRLLNPAGLFIGDTWRHADGSYGSTTIDPVTGIRVTSITDSDGVTTTSSSADPGNSTLDFGSVSEAISNISAQEKAYETALASTILQRYSSEFNAVSAPAINIVNSDAPIVHGEIGTGEVDTEKVTSTTVTTTSLVPVTTESWVDDYKIPLDVLISKYSINGVISQANLPPGYFIEQEEEIPPSASGGGTIGTQDVLTGYQVQKLQSQTTMELVTQTVTKTYTAATLTPIEQIQAGANGQTVLLGQGEEVVNASGDGDLVGPDNVTPQMATNVLVESVEYDYGDTPGQAPPLYAQYTDQGEGSFVNASGQNDTVVGSQGDDTIVCGAGNDFINGGGGSDTFLVYPALISGWDVIDDTVSFDPTPLSETDQSWYAGYIADYGGSLIPTAPVNTFAFESGVTPAELQFGWAQVAQAGNQWALDISWGNSGGIRIVMHNEDNAIFTFQNGTTLSLADILALAPPKPDVAGIENTETLPVLNTQGNELFSYTLPANLFVTTGSTAGALSYSVTLADGSPLPNWLQFNPVSQTLTGMPGGTGQQLQLNVTSTDSAGQTLSTPLVLTVSTDDPASNVTATTTYNSDGSYAVTMTVNGTKSVTNNYSAAGILLSNSWWADDDSEGSDTFASGGASSGSTYEVNGTTISFNADGAGNIKTQSISSEGIVYADTWTHQDGSHGYDAFNPDGSSSGATVNADNSYSTYTNDGHSDITTTDFTAAGVRMGEVWSKADRSHGTISFSPNGSSTGTVVNPDNTYSTYTNDGSDNLTVLYYSADGTLLGHGSTNPDGSGTRTNNDGTYSNFTSDGQGDVSTQFYSATGTLVQNGWIRAGGLSGSETVHADGSSNGQWNSTDGTAVIFSSNVNNDINAQRITDGSGYHEFIAGNGNDNIEVTAGYGNTITLGTGRDNVTLDAGAWANVNAGNGVETITSPGWGGEALNLGDFSSDQIWLQRSGSSLVISVMGQKEQITLNGWYTNSNPVFQEIEAGNQTMSNWSVNQLVSAMAAFAPPAPGQTALTPQELQQLQPALSAAWN